MVLALNVQRAVELLVLVLFVPVTSYTLAFGKSKFIMSSFGENNSRSGFSRGGSGNNNYSRNREDSNGGIRNRSGEYSGGNRDGSRTKTGGTEEKAWRSGQIFGKQTQRKSRNDPWWMRDDESANPRILPSYRPWWWRVSYTDDETARTAVVEIDNAWKIAELRAEAKRRGVPNYSNMKKKELIEGLQRLSSLYDLSDDGFVSPKYIVDKSKENLTCYPHVYESDDTLKDLNMAGLQLRAPV